MKWNIQIRIQIILNLITNCAYSLGNSIKMSYAQKLLHEIASKNRLVSMRVIYCIYNWFRSIATNLLQDIITLICNIWELLIKLTRTHKSSKSLYTISMKNTVSLDSYSLQNFVLDEQSPDTIFSVQCMFRIDLLFCFILWHDN